MSNKKVNPHWDNVWVHGSHPDTQYIGRRTGRENTEALKKIAPHLKKSYELRLAKHTEKLNLLKKIIKLLSTLVSLLKKQRES